MATITEEYKTGTGTSRTFTTQYINETDIKVRVNGGAPLTFSTGTLSTGQYNIASNATTITFGDSYSGTDVLHIYSETDVSSPTVSFTPGSSIKAADLNSLETLVRHGIKENRNQIIDQDIRPGVVTSSHIKDGTLVDADISGSASIAQSKLATGTLPSGIQVNSANIVDGSIVNADVSPSANIQGSKLADDSVPLTKLGSGSLPSDITISDNYVNRSIKEEDIQVGALDNRYYTETELDAGQLDNRYYTEDELRINGAIDSRYYTETELDNGVLDTRYFTEGELSGGALDTRYYNESELDAGQLDNRYYTETELNAGQLDTRYYTETELLNEGKIDGRYYTETELDAGQLDNRYFTETELTSGGLIDSRYYTETELDAGQLDTRYYTEAELNGGQLNDQYFQESELLGGALDGRYFTETEIANGAADTRYYTETELDAGQLDNRYYTETEAEALFLRQDSSETIASGVTWSNADDKVATTAAINARIIDLVDEVGGFTVIATELVFPNTNPQGATGQAAILSIGALTQGYTRSGTTVTIANGTIGNSTVTITGVPLDLPSGFGLLVESTATLNTYTFHRLVPKATEVTTVATNITNIVAAGANVSDINNFADLYQISGSAPTQRVDGNSLVSGDLWFDNSNGNLRVWNGSAWAIITPAQSVLDDVAIVSGAITYSEDLGLITDPVTTGSSNGSLDIVADALEDEATFTVTASGGAFLIDGVSKPALTLYKGWTYTFDVSNSSNGAHPLRFYAGSSQYSTNVVVTGTQGSAGAKVSIKIPETQPTNFQYYCTNHSGMGNTITVKDDPIKTVSDNVVKIIATADNSSNINAVQANESNINAVQANASNINAAVSNATNINAAVSNASDISAVAGNNSNITAVANNETNINAVKNNETNINAVNANKTNIDAVAGNNSNITAVANNSSNINSAVSNASNINSAVSNASNINSAVSNATNINTVATNITDVNTFADRYQIATSNPSTDGGGNALAPGDLFFNSSANELRIWNGTQWQGGVTAVGDLSQVSGSTFTGDNKYNDNIKVKFGTDSDLLIFHDTNDSIINEAGTGNLKIQNAGSTKVEVTATGASITGLMSATTIDGSAGNNLTLDFGTL